MHLIFIDRSWHIKDVFRIIKYFSNSHPRKFHYWSDWSNRLTTSAFIVWLAGYVADDLVQHRNESIEQLIIKVETDTSNMQNDAEQFLQRIYLPYAPFTYQHRRMTRIFRHLIQHQLQRRSSITYNH